MKAMRVLAAGIVGGIVMFAWGAAAHMFTPIGEMGIKNMPGEARVTPVLKEVFTEPGFYFFPPLENRKHATEAEEKEWEAKYKAGPRGVIIIDPKGAEIMSPRQLGSELASDVMAALLAAVILCNVRCSLAGRALTCGLMGVFAWLSVDVSFWSWYLFPTELIIGELLDQSIGWLAAGVVMAVILGRPREVAVVTVTQ